MKRSCWSLTVAIVLCLALAPAALGLSRFEPGITLIGTAELKAEMDRGTDMVLINTLSPLEFRNRSIPGSINIPYEHALDGKSAFPAGKDRMLVFYCKGPK